MALLLLITILALAAWYNDDDPEANYVMKDSHQQQETSCRRGAVGEEWREKVFCVVINIYFIMDTTIIIKRKYKK